MRVLIVSWYFPPSNTIGALRIGHFARDLLAAGHDVQVLTVADPPYAQTLSLAFPDDRVHLSRWFDINDAPGRFVGRLKRLGRRLTSSTPKEGATPGAASAASSPAATKALPRESRLSRNWRRFTNIPDREIGWAFDANRVGRSLLNAWRPDVVFASGPPHTTLVIARRLVGAVRIPLVIEFRDRWWDDPYYREPYVRRWIERRLEAWVLGKAVGITTVSQPWAETYEQRYGLPVGVIYNGYDPALIADAEATGAIDSSTLEIGYFGGIYVGRRDPTPLFQALTRPEVADLDIRISFYGTQDHTVWPLADREGVRDRISVHPSIPHEEVVRIERRSDVLLLMQWNNPLEQGNVPGKLFEYLASRRPILGLGIENGVPASIIRSRGAGVYANDPAEIARHLRAWAETKRTEGRIPPMPSSVREGFSRPEQSRALMDFLEARCTESAGERT